MPVANLFTADDEAPQRRRPMTPAQMMGEVLLRQGTSTEPTNSKLVGVGRIATGALGGYMAGLEAKRQAEAEAAGARELGNVLLGGQGGTTFAPTASGVGATTSAGARPTSFDPGRIPSFVQAAGVPHGISPDYLTKTAWLESKGDPNAVSPTGAKGIFQFTGGTAKQFALANPFDPAASADAAARLAASNRDSLRGSLGRDPTDAELYLAHQQGAGGASKLLANPTARAGDIVGDRAVRVNGGDPNMPAGAFAKLWTDRYNGLGAAPQPATGPGGMNAPDDKRPAWARPVGDEPGAYGTTVQAGDPNADAPLPPARPDFADMPDASASPAALSMSMDSGDPVPAGGGFIIPGAGQVVPLDASGSSVPAVPPVNPNAPTLDVLGQITGGGQQPVPPTLRGTIDPAQPDDGSTPLPEITVAGNPPPLPPPRPQDLGAILTGQPAPPLPPARPQLADMPAPGARPAMLTDAQQIGRLLQGGAMPDMSNADNAGAREFTASQADPRALGAVVANFRPGQGGTSGNPDAVALGRTLLGQPISAPQPAPPAAMASAGPMAPAASAAPVPGAPQGLMPPGSAGGSTPGPNGPVTAPVAAPGGVGMSPQMLASVNALANSPNPAHQAIAKTIITKALEGTKAQFNDNGDETLIANEQGQIIGRLPKAKAADFGVVGKDAYGQDIYGYRNYGDRSVTRPDVSGGAPAGAPVDMNGQPIPQGVDPKTVRETQSKSYAGNTVPADSKATAEVRQEVLGLPSYKNLKQASPVYRAMVSTADTDTKASDLNLIYGMGKIMDPGSVVREGEMALANGTSGLDQRLAGFANSVFGGSRLTPQTRAALLAEAHGRMKSYEDEYTVDAQHYQGIAKRGRMAPEDVVPTFEPMKPWTPKGQDGATTIQPGASTSAAGGITIRRVK